MSKQAKKVNFSEFFRILVNGKVIILLNLFCCCFAADSSKLICLISAGRGHYAAMDYTDTRAGYRARLVSPYINTTGKCLELFYRIRQQLSNDVETRLTVISISENHTEDVLDTTSDLAPNFEKLHLRLRDGVHRIAIEGERSKKKRCGLSLDDVTIMDCDRLGKLNTEIKL